MSKISVEDSKCSVLSHEGELKEKIEDLETNMVYLLNQLIEEKRKLNEVLHAKNVEQVTDSNKVNENSEQNQSDTVDASTEQFKHLPTCPYSRIILEVDPNCVIHGHIYNDPNKLNPNSVLTNFSAKNENIISNSNYSESHEVEAAGGDNKEESVNYLKLIDQFVPGDYTSEAREMLAYHLQRISNIGSETNLDKDRKTDHNLSIIHDATSNIETNDISSLNIVELQTKHNSETSFTNELDASRKNLFELREKYFTNNSLNNLTDFGNNNNSNNITDKTLEYKDIPLNSAYLENELDELNSSMMEQGELDILLKALKMSYYGSFIEDLPINLLGELLEKNK